MRKREKGRGDGGGLTFFGVVGFFFLVGEGEGGRWKVRG